MLTIGLAGGIASGKSIVARQFEELGAKVLDADGLGHEVLRQEVVVREILTAFGPEVVNSDGQLDRRSIAGLVFEQSDQAKKNLLTLEQITHPKISELIRARIGQYRDEKCPAAVLDAPVMFKAGWDRMCDKIVFVQTDFESRLKRAVTRGWSEQGFLAREASQTPIEVKLSKATDVIDNNNGLAETNQHVRRLWEKWNLMFVT